MALTDGLIFRHILDEGTGTSATDEQGNWNGTLDTASWVNDATYGDVYDSNATNEIDCGSGSMGSLSAASWAFTINPEEQGTVQNYTIAKYSTVTNGRSFRIYLDQDEDIFLQVSSDGAGNEGQKTTTTLTPGTWTKVIITFDSGTFAVYCDNSSVGVDANFSTHTSIFDSTTNSNLVIGNNVVGGTSGLEGLLRNTAMWNRVLTAQDRTDYQNDAWGGGPSITNMEDERFHWGESGIVITGTNFGT